MSNPVSALDANAWSALFQMLSAIFTPIALSILALVNWKTGKRAQEQASNAAVQVDKVKSTLESTEASLSDSAKTTKNALSMISGKTDEIHILVNSKLGKLLRDHAVMLRAAAINARRLVTFSKSPACKEEDLKQAKLLEEAADEAEMLANEHDLKQSVVDRSKIVTK